MMLSVSPEATLRRYGQTNCFVGTSIKYGVFAAKDGEAYVCTYRAARNMAFQGILEKSGEVTQLAEIDGAKLVGTKIKAPFAIHPEVYVLPMDNVLATKVSQFMLTISFPFLTSFVHMTRVPELSPPFRQTLLMTSRLSQTFARNPSTTRSSPSGVPSTPSLS
jgi:leucyl-tRNA synthetase